MIYITRRDLGDWIQPTSLPPLLFFSQLAEGKGAAEEACVVRTRGGSNENAVM